MTINAASSNYISPFWGGVKKFAKNYANFVFGVEQNDKFSEELKLLIKGDKKNNIQGHGFKNFNQDVKSAWGESKKVLLDSTGKEKSFWNVIKDSFKGFGGEWKAAQGFKKSFGVLWKRMPLIGNVIMVASEIPNLYKAYTQGGLATGINETLKAAGKLGVMTAGMALGAVFGPIGGIAGAMLGGILGDKIFGKSYSDKKAEEEAEKNKVDGKTGAAAGAGNLQQAQQDPSVAAQDATQVANQSVNPYLSMGIDPNIVASMSPDQQAYFQQALQAQMSGQQPTAAPSFSGNNVQTNPNQSLFTSSPSIFSSATTQNQYGQYPWMNQNMGLNYMY